MAGHLSELRRNLKTALLVSKHSLYSRLIEQVMAREEMPPRWRGEGPSLPGFLQSPPCLVVWDLSGFSPQRVSDFAARLQADHIGLLLVCGQVGDQLMETAMGCRPNQVISEPRTPAELAAAFFTGLANYERIIGGLSQKMQHQQRLSERELIERAKSRLMKACNLKESEAMRHLQQVARNSNQRLAEVAARILKSPPDQERDEEE